MVAFGLLIASCSSDSDEIKTSSQRLTTELILKSGDSIPTTFATDDVILPPKKP